MKDFIRMWYERVLIRFFLVNKFVKVLWGFLLYLIYFEEGIVCLCLSFDLYVYLFVKLLIEDIMGVCGFYCELFVYVFFMFF